MRPRLLLTGANGQVGWELRRTLAPLGQVFALGRAELDLADTEAVRARIREIRPALVVNAAAFTAVDRAENERDLAYRVNAAAPGVMAEEAERLGVPLVHFSTDYVFDGVEDRAYREDDSPAPRNVYGETKLQGEQAIARSGARHLVLRTSWVYGTRGANFLTTILRLAREREALRVVDDQIGAPTWCRALAEGTAVIMARLRSPTGFDLPEEVSGRYHLAASGLTSWCGFARAILARAEGETLRVHEPTPIPTAEYPTPASRPAFSVLDCTRVRETFGIALPSWKTQLDLCMDWTFPDRAREARAPQA